MCLRTNGTTHDCNAGSCSSGGDSSCSLVGGKSAPEHLFLKAFGSLLLATCKFAFGPSRPMVSEKALVPIVHHGTPLYRYVKFVKVAALQAEILLCLAPWMT